MSKTANTQEPAHAKFSASGSSRWLNCPGSIALSEKAPPQQSSQYADEGTKAHECFEYFLNNLTGDSSEARAELIAQGYDTEMVTHAEVAMYEILDLRGTRDCKILVEERVGLGFVRKDMFGTVDCALLEEFGELTVADFKYGAGVYVGAEANTQMIYYALGIAKRYEDFCFDTVKLVVIQPRKEDEDGNIVRTYTMSIDELTEWEKTFGEGVDRCLRPDAPLAAGSWCRFCPATTVCPQLSQKALETAQAEFAEVIESPGTALVDVKHFLDTDLGKVLDACDHLEKWIADVRTFAFDRANRGEAVPGYKLVNKRSTRKWTNPDEVLEEIISYHGEEIAYAPAKLRSPNQVVIALSTRDDGIPPMKKKTAESWVNQRVTKQSPGLTLVSESDKRQAVNPIDEFDVIEAESKDVSDFDLGF